MTMPAQISDYVAGNHRFELSTPSGARHEMFFSATVERAGANLRLRVRLTNAADQLALPLAFEDEINTPAQAGKEPARKIRRRNGTTPDSCLLAAKDSKTEEPRVGTECDKTERSRWAQI